MGEHASEEPTVKDQIWAMGRDMCEKRGWPKTPECDKFRGEGDFKQPVAAAKIEAAAPAKTEPATMNVEKPAAETLAKMSGPAPSQGFEGGMVEHKNKTTSVGDWRQEY